ncbi:MAG: dockerin type I repeat-containing protein [Alistipes sp.]|nr:dockerin type I repeat-containing protein [Alistipes sp.]
MNKKLMKRFLSAFAAASISALSLIPATSAALPPRDNLGAASNSDSVIAEWTEGLTPLDEKYSFLYEKCAEWSQQFEDGTLDKPEVVYFNNEKKSWITLYWVRPLDYEKECITLADGVSVEQVDSCLQEFFASVDILSRYTPYLIEEGKLDDGTPYYSVVGSGNNEDNDMISVAACRRLKEQELISGYTIAKNYCHLENITFHSFLSYDRSLHGDQFDEIAAYVIEKGVGELDENGDVRACPGVTSAEQLETALEVYEKFGVCPVSFRLETPNQVASGVTIDLYNAIEGDANDDGKVDIADATLILQYIGNPDKYQLTPQGEYNADVDCSGGVTALDALEVQRIDAKLG